MEFLQSFDNHLEDMLHRLCVRLQTTATREIWSNQGINLLLNSLLQTKVPLG